MRQGFLVCSSGMITPGREPQPTLDALAPALDISSVEPTRISTPQRFESSILTPAPSAEYRFNMSSGQGLPHSFCSVAARSSFSTDTASFSQTCLPLRIETTVAGSTSGLAPCARVERARAASNPPKLQLAGPSRCPSASSPGHPTHRSWNASFRSRLTPNLVGAFHQPSPARSSLPGSSSRDDSWAPLPAPRGPPPRVWQRPSSADVFQGRPPRKLGSETVELSGPPQLASPTRDARNACFPVEPMASSQSCRQDAAAHFEHGDLRAAREAHDEVNCQSPKVAQALGPKVQSSTTSSCEIAVQTDSIANESNAASCAPELSTRADGYVSTSQEVSAEAGCPVGRRTNSRWRHGIGRREILEEVLLSQDTATEPGAVCTPEKPCFQAFKHDTPDFGDMVSAQASSLWRGSFEAIQPMAPRDTLSVERGDGVARRLDGDCFRLASSPFADTGGIGLEAPKSADAVEQERLNQQLLEALARGLAHLRRMQSLAAPSSWERPHAA